MAERHQSARTYLEQTEVQTLRIFLSDVPPDSTTVGVRPRGHPTGAHCALQDYQKALFGIRCKRSGPAPRKPRAVLRTDRSTGHGVHGNPPGNPVGRLGWSCTSSTGLEWHCDTVSTVGTPQAFHDFADPWLADTRGDPCPTYGSGIRWSEPRRTTTRG